MKLLKLVLVFSAVAFASPFNGSGRAQTQEELLELGTYIFKGVQGCGCHTPRNPDGSEDMNRYLAGAPSQPPPMGPPANVGWTNLRWKKLYARNITPDVETGIGEWTESDFITAMKTGKTPDGRILDPFMPWIHFQGITDRDLKAMWAYLRSIKPVRNRVPQSIPADRTRARGK